MQTTVVQLIAGVAVASSGVALAFAGAVRVVSEPRRLSTGFVLLAAVVLLGAGAAVVVAGLIPATSPGGGAVALVAVPLAVAGIGLIVNGLGLMRRDGIAPLTATPVVVGAGLLFLLAAAAMVESGPRVPSWAGRVTVIAIVAGVYLVVHMIAFGGYALLYGTLPVRPEADAVVILGCGLDRRSVTPLLAARLDRGIAVYDVAVRSGHDPVVVTCGGQGPDEATTEADAMARYLVAAGVPPHSVIRERHSRNTAENLRNCLRELELRGIPAHDLRMTLVTSNFHVLRAAALTRRLGIDAQVVGSATAAYFLPAAFLREFVAVLATHYRRSHLAVAAIILIALLAIITDLATQP